ncbi:DUF5979 domain-containing protein [Microbacterium hominis]|uniref:DUF5979 domain-containing protein n=1 Tax=Microbacterium hominis TaxID=162426 RepID=A0A7D4Q6A7_9MICO|nr:DUF5979 domain-containing protein [Microbacterium hominis]QKJ17999.1 hypothetical protein HQM25_00235 [Microbacterium hominis]
MTRRFVREAHHRRWTLSAIATAILLAIGLVAPGAAVALPDPAPDDITALATLEKETSATEVVPGEQFAYTLTMGCSAITDLGCRGAVLSDTVPAPFVLVGASVGGGENIADAPIISGNSVTVNWTTPLGDGTVGLLDATTGIVVVTAVLPLDTSYDVSGIPVLNNALLEGTNFADVDSSVEVTPVIELALETIPTKTLTPDTAIAIPGTEVDAALSATNDSNATVESLVIQDPIDPLAAPNPFEYLGFVGFGTVTPPPGTTGTTYEVFVDGAWVEAPGGVLPAGVDPADVRGTRVTFTGAIPAGTSGSVALDLALTDAAAALDDGTVVDNTVQSTVSRDGQIDTGESSDQFTIRQNTVTTTASKSFDPALLLAGDSSEVTIGGTNSSAIPIESLSFREPSSGVFPDAYTFTGISGGITYPAGATTGTIIYHTAGGGTESFDFPSGADPPDPAAGVENVEWFEVVFTGEIEVGAGTTIPFTVETDPDLTPLPQTVPNEVLVTGENAGVTGPSTADDNLFIYDEVIETYIDKTIRPSQILAIPGEVITVSLAGGLTERPNPPDQPTGTTGRTDQVVIQDPDDPVEPDDFWNAFDLTSIAQTAVPADSTLTIEYYDTTDDTWKVLAGPIDGPTIFTTEVPADIQDVAGGIRFTYDYTGADGGFAPGTDFAPNFTAELRPDGRYEPGPPFSDTESTFVPNCGQTSATASTPGVDSDTTAIPEEECPEVELVPPPGDLGGAGLIDKEFGTSSSGGVKTVIARSGDTIPSTLFWSTGGRSGFERVIVTDIADPEGTALADSMFDEFDVVRVPAITTDPYLIYDEVLAVELFDGTQWIPAANDPCPAACIGTFPGVDLTAAERASTLGIRLIFVESPDRAAASAGNLDAPPVGSGVARSPSLSRSFDIVWQVRDERRSDGTPILEDVEYNIPGQQGVVRNTANTTGIPQDGGDPWSADQQDDVSIVDVPITTTTDKNWSGGPLAVPADPNLPAVEFPVSQMVVTTRNTTPARVDTLAIIDPAPGSVTDRTDDPFQAFTFVQFARITLPSGATDATVEVFCPGGNVEYTRDEALALNAASVPCDIEGFQVVFTGRIAAAAAGQVAVDLRLRAFWRGTDDERVSIADNPLSNTALGVVADVDEPDSCPPPLDARYACDQATATINLIEASFGVRTSKSITPATQTEPDDTPVTMTLRAQPTGSARTQTLTILDDDPTFWNAFDFVEMDAAWELPPPVARVQACYLDGGSFTAANVEADTVGGTWTCMDRPGDLSLAAAIAFLDAAPETLHGLSFQFWNELEIGWDGPVDPLIEVPITMQRRADLRTGGPVPTTRADETPAPGEQTQGIFFNTVNTSSLSVAIAPGVRLDAEASASAEYRYLHLEASVNVSKSPTGLVEPGQVIPFELSFTNTGQRPLDTIVFTDVLPTDDVGRQLIFDPDGDPTVPPWSFELTGDAPDPPSGPPLPTDPAEVDVQEIGDTIVFTMPPDAVLEVGQTYTITLQMVLRPGVTSDDLVRNETAIEVSEPLDDCVPNLGPEPTRCWDDTTVTPLAVPALSTVKLVRADTPVDEPGIPTVLSDTNGFDCAGTVDPEGFYRYPCVPMTLPGDTETWRFRVTNSGTLPMDEIVAIDNLPTPGDQGLIVIVPRGSEWTPEFVGGIELVPTPSTPAGATLTTSYSTSSVPCTSDLNPVGTPCAAGAWTPWTPDVDPLLVRSLKFEVTFADGALFEPGNSLTLQFQTRTSPDAPIDADYPRAYNTVSTGGAALDDDTRIVVPATEGRRVGVTYPTGPMQLQKIVTGPEDELAPDSFPVQLVCTTVDGDPVEPLPELVLVPGDPPTVVEGLPWGATCTATEGEFGQTDVVIGTAVVGGPEDEIGLVTVENIYDTAALRVVKVVDAAGLDSLGNPIEYGPFPFSAQCFFLGEEVFAIRYGPDAPMQVMLEPGQLWALAGLPVGAECTITEDDALGGTVTWTVDGSGDPVGPTDGSSVEVVVEDGAVVAVTATNTFTAGSLELEKVIEGLAGPDFGAGPFLFFVSCVLDTGDGLAIVRTARVELGGDQPLTATIDDIATGARCFVRELDDGGATDRVIEPGSVVIGGDGTTVTVTATNIFAAGSLVVTKVVDGDGAELWGAGPFEVTLSCLDEDGASVDIPGGAVRELSAENGYTTTYDPLLIGLECTLTETGTGGATTTVVADADGIEVDVIEVVDGETAITVTNTFEVGGFEVVKTVSGGDGPLHVDDVFEIAADCVWNGAVIEVPGGGVRALTVDEPVAFEDLPVGAVCTVTETDDMGADAVTFTPANDDDPLSATVEIGADAAASITIDNRFDTPPPPLPPTGVDGDRAVAGVLIALMLIAGGVGAVVIGRRRLLAS